MIFRAVICAGSLAVMSLPALAADLPSTRGSAIYVPPPILAFSWTGFDIGGQVGYQWGHADAPYGDPGTGTFPFAQGPAKQRGVVGGAHVGYNYQFQSIVVGVEGDIEGTSVGGDDGGSGGNVNGLYNHYQASIRGKIGYAFDRVLPYATGGVAFMSAKPTAPADVGSSGGLHFTGYTVGGGIAYAITDQWSVYAEYRYTNFETAVAHFADYDEKYDPKDNAVRVGFSYLFTSPAGQVVAKY